MLPGLEGFSCTQSHCEQQPKTDLNTQRFPFCHFFFSCSKMSEGKLSGTEMAHYCVLHVPGSFYLLALTSFDRAFTSIVLDPAAPPGMASSL